MSKVFKIFLVLILSFIFCLNSSLENEYLNGAPEEDNTALPEDPLEDAYSHEQAVGISTNSSGLSVSSIINILLIAVGIIIIFLAIAIIIRLK